ncbi:MAG: peptidylprolyl isomerase [Ruminococcus sp.]|nr:peptidylprolyl isomerase [Ruminococcus sp.]
MKNIKRILPILLCVIVIIGLMSACGDKGKSSSKKGSNSSAVTVTDSGNSLEESNGKADKDDSKSDGKNSSKNDKDSSKAKSADGKDDDSNSSSASGGKSVKTDTKTTTDSSVSNDSNSSDKSSASSKKSSDGSSKKSSDKSKNSKSDSSKKSKDNSKSSKDKDSSKKADKDSSSNTDITDGKSFVITTYSKYAPITCKNFDTLVKDGFYNGLRFYRVIDKFLTETGDPNNDGSGGSDKTIKGEFMANGVKNTLSHTKGVVSMQRQPSDMNSATSKFFICYHDNCKFMDGNYAAFGKVTEGMSVVESFVSVERVKGTDGSISLPVTPITITKAEYIGKDSKGNSQYRFTVTF